jgi:hypothetical protein
MANQTVTVKGLQEALDSLTVFQRVRIPGSVAWSLNKFAVWLRDYEQKNMQHTFNKLNKFTQNAPLYKLATKENPRMLFFLRDNAPGGNSPDRYLEPQASGGPVYVTRFSRALRRAGAIDPNQYVMHWANPNYKPTPGFISSLVSALATSSGPIKSARQYARNVNAKSQYFIKRQGDEQGLLLGRQTGPATGIFKRKSKNNLDLVYKILKAPPTVKGKYDWDEKRMALLAEDQIPILLFQKLSEF